MKMANKNKTTLVSSSISQPAAYVVNANGRRVKCLSFSISFFHQPAKCDIVLLCILQLGKGSKGPATETLR